MCKIKGVFILLVIVFLFSVIINRELYAADIYPEIKIKKENNFDNFSFNISGLISDVGFDLEEYYFQSDFLNGQLTVGRKYVKSGPGYFSQLMLSNQNTPLDFIIHQGKIKFIHINSDYTMMVAYLGEKSNKQLFHHRVSNKTLIKGLELGISEAMMVSEKINPAYYLPLPFLPYYLTAYISGLYNDYNYHDDKYIGLDFNYKFNNSLELYGELLVDEFPQSPGNRNPDKRAHLLGIYYPFAEKTNFRIEYSNVFNYVYLHHFPENRYTFDGKYIGHWLGNDGDVLDLQLARDLDRSTTIKVGFRYLRKGIGDMQTDYSAEPDYQEKKFLAEIRRREALIRLGYEKNITDNLELKIDSEIGKAILEEKAEKSIFNINIGIVVSL